MDPQVTEQLIDDLLIEKPNNPDHSALYSALIALLKAQMPQP